jgi:DNA-binding HxlR family transcriptional regulator
MDDAVRAVSADPDGEPAVWFGAPVRSQPEEGEGSPSEGLYRLIGSRWVVAVLRELDGDVVRYNTLHRRLGGISHKMLTQTLRRLERAHLVLRHAHATTPPNVEYLLTAAGAELVANLTALERWAEANGLPL